MAQVTKQTFKNSPSANLAKFRKVSFFNFFLTEQKTEIMLFKTHKEQTILSSGKQ